MKREKESEEFIQNYVKFEFINLVIRYDLSVPIPPFGIENVLFYFKELVPIKDWEELIKACAGKDEDKCLEYIKKNPFFKKYSEFQTIHSNINKEAQKYLKNLRTKAFFSGMVPGVDIGMEYFYKNQFVKKLKSLYGFDFYKALEKSKNNEKNILIKKDEKDIEEKEIILDVNDLSLNESTYQVSSNYYEEENENLINRQDSNQDLKEDFKNKEKDVESKISETEHNAGKNITSFLRGLGEVGGIVLKALPTAGSITLETGEVVLITGISVGLKL